MPNRTKIIATIGPASNDKALIRKLVQAGVNVCRLNFSHGTHEQHAQSIQYINELNEELDTNIGILADLQGPKIRLGKELESEKIHLQTGTIITLTSNETVSTASLLHITYDRLAIDLKRGERVLIDDGKVELKVLSSNGKNEVQAEVIYGGPVSSRKGVNLPDSNLTVSTLTAKDIDDLKFILANNVNWIALSFVRTADEITRLKGMLDFNSHPAKVIAKIEKPEALKNIDAIIKVSDAIMIARGDLGVEMPLQRIPVLQKELINKCIVAYKPVIVATQMMESMINNPSPTRAEITDVATAIFDGADALMLSGETAVGKHPVKVIETFTKVIKEIEGQDNIYQKRHTPKETSPTFLADAICYNACRIAHSVNAKAIIGMTQSGYTAFMLSSHRPKADIYVFTESRELLNMVSLIWGVKAFYYTGFESTDKTIADVQQVLKDAKLIQSGDIVINTGSMPLSERGRTNTIKVSLIH